MATLSSIIPPVSVSTASGTLPVSNGGTGADTLTGVVKGNGTSAMTAGAVNLASEVSGILPATNGGTGLISPGASGNLLTSNGSAWTSAAAPSSFPLTLVNTTTITSSTSFYEQTNLSSFSDYMLFIYFLNCSAGNPSGYLIQDDNTQRTWTETLGRRAFNGNNTGTAWTVGPDVSNRVWTNSGNISYFYMTMGGFGTDNLRWRSEYQSFEDSSNYGYQLGKSESSSLGVRTFKGFRITFPAAATTGIIQLYRRG